MELFKSPFKNRDGFTLIELLIVMVVLGILALLIIPRISDYLRAAETTQCQSAQREVESAAMRYRIEDGTLSFGTAGLTVGDLVFDDEEPPEDIDYDSFILIGDMPDCWMEDDTTLKSVIADLTFDDDGRLVTWEYCEDFDPDSGEGGDGDPVAPCGHRHPYFRD